MSSSAFGWLLRLVLPTCFSSFLCWIDHTLNVASSPQVTKASGSLGKVARPQTFETSDLYK